MSIERVYARTLQIYISTSGVRASILPQDKVVRVMCARATKHAHANPTEINTCARCPKTPHITDGRLQTRSSARGPRQGARRLYMRERHHQPGRRDEHASWRRLRFPRTSSLYAARRSSSIFARAQSLVCVCVCVRLRGDTRVFVSVYTG